MEVIDIALFSGSKYDPYFEFWRERQKMNESPFLFTQKNGQKSLKTEMGQSAFELGEVTANQLRQIAGDNDLASFTVLLTAFAILLRKYTGENHIIIDTPVYLIQPQDKWHVECVPLCLKVVDDETLKEHLSQFKNIIQDVCKYQNFPISLLEDAETPNTLRSNIGLTFEGIHGPLENGNHDLVIAVKKKAKSFVIELQWAKECYDLYFINHIQGHLEKTLSYLISIDSKISEIDFLTEGERKQVIEKFNDTASPHQELYRIDELFEQQVKKNPKAPAVVFQEEEVSYEELDLRSDKLAQYLLTTSNFQSGTIVGIALNRSVHTVVAMLGILKAGGIYLPLDAGFPEERKNYMLEDAGADVLITESDLMFDIQSFTGDIFAIDIQLDEVQLTHKRVITNTANDIAYIIYTSGSTGQPKGVQIAHKSCVNIITDHIERLSITADDNVLQFAAQSFDVATCEIFMALLSGGTIVIPTAQMLMESTILVDYMRAHQVSIALFTASYYNLFDPVLFSFLRAVITGGEAPHIKRVEKAVAYYDYYNAYGPTECAICSTIYKFEIKGQESQLNIPIGKPISNVQIYILDEYLNPLPVGINGEIYIGGEGLTTGYINNEALTLMKLVENPFNPSQKIYKTGDVGKWRVDGNLEFVGRNDDQVKLRGFRIELGEINGVLGKYSGIDEAVTFITEEVAGAEKLCSAITLNKEASFTTARMLNLKSESLEIFHKLYTLPDGLTVLPINQGETELLHKEIFEDHCYLKNNIKINKGDVIFDVGANIGMFSLYMGLHFEEVKIYAFEPIPQTFSALNTNASLYDIDVENFNIGFGNEEAVVPFTYFPNNTALSGRYATSESEEKLVRDFIKNQTVRSEVKLSNEQMDNIVKDKLVAQTVNCQIKKLSNFIQEHKITEIGLLKIDVEKSELEVLKGITTGDWNKIRQVVIEVHDIDDHLIEVQKLLQDNGFVTEVNQEMGFEETLLYNVFGTRGTPSSDPIEITPPKALKLVGFDELLLDIKAHCRQYLPDYMVPTDFKLLDRIPLTANGKVDTAKVMEMEGENISEKEYVAPRNKIEERIHLLWCQVLEVNTISINTNFFDLGGNSLKVINLLELMNADYGECIKVGDLFDQPTIQMQAEIIQQATEPDSEENSEFNMLEF